MWNCHLDAFGEPTRRSLIEILSEGECPAEISYVLEEVLATLEGKLVKRPGHSGEDGKVYLVENGRKRWVAFAAWLESHGCKVPDDVSVIAAEELDSIHTGEVIQ